MTPHDELLAAARAVLERWNGNYVFASSPEVARLRAAIAAVEVARVEWVEQPDAFYDGAVFMMTAGDVRYCIQHRRSGDGAEAEPRWRWWRQNTTNGLAFGGEKHADTLDEAKRAAEAAAGGGR